MTEKKKICPLMSIAQQGHYPCMGKECALWISIAKEIENPYIRLEYEGCGLIQRVPWRLEKRDIEAENR